MCIRDSRSATHRANTGASTAQQSSSTPHLGCNSNGSTDALHEFPRARVEQRGRPGLAGTPAAAQQQRRAEQ
eukprot:14272757-Alexandrium_andersonii.AAC.1